MIAWRRSAASCSRSRTKASSRPSRPTRGSSSTTETCTCRRAATTAIPSGKFSTSFGATATTSCRTTTSLSSLIPSTTGATEFYFQTSPLGAIRDAVFTDEGNQNDSWNTVWDVKAERFEGGWTMEMAIPFKSLRYRGAGPQVWGINFRRIVRWKNETSFLTRVPAAYGRLGVFYVSSAGSLVGVETPSQSMNLEVKPYVVSSLTTDRAAAVPYDNRIDRNAGFDFKYGLTRSLIADATYNTDFAQVEEDVQQVNLTRFSLFFPEKREFFLEGQGLFAFGSGSRPRGGVAGGVLARRGGGVGRDVPILFFSRRIGLSDGQSVPVVAGGRLTGKVGRFRARRAEYSDRRQAVGRGRGDQLLGRAAQAGRPATQQHRRPRHQSDTDGWHPRLGPDLGRGRETCCSSRTWRSILITLARGALGGPGDQSSYRGRFDYSGDRYGLQLEHLLVGDGFNPEVGFLRRSDFRRSSFGARFSPRPKSSRLIRKFGWDVSYDYITNARRTLVENRKAQGDFNIEFNNSDRWNVRYTREFEYLPQSFEIAPGVILPVGAYAYEFRSVRVHPRNEPPSFWSLLRQPTVPSMGATGPKQSTSVGSGSGRA